MTEERLNPLQWLQSKFASLVHTHTKSQITDFPSIPSKTSDLQNDSGFLTSHQDISGKEDTINKVTSLSSSSTNTQYPSAKAVYDEFVDKAYRDCHFKPYNASMWQDVDGGTQTVSVTDSTVYNSGVNRQGLKEIFTESDDYILEFDFVTTTSTRVGLTFGIDGTQTRNSYCLFTDIYNTKMSNDSTSTELKDMGLNLFKANTTQHIKFVRDGNIAELYLDDELLYTITDMNDYHNRFGLWKWGGGTITISNVSLKIPSNKEVYIPDYADLGDYNTTGFYYCNLSSSRLQTITNCPVGDGFSMVVEESHTFKDTGYKQTLTTWSVKPKVYVRTYSFDNIFHNPPVEQDSGWQLVYEDTGWTNITSFSSKFQNYYPNSDPLQFRRIGKIVHFRGLVKNKVEIKNGGNSEVIFTIPSDCRPSATIRLVMHGSYSYRFLLILNPNGNATIERYGSGTTYSNLSSSGVWMNMYGTYFVD